MIPGALDHLRGKLRRVIYDCDGVLIDSESISSRVCAAEITKLGWQIDAAECEARFRGMQLRDMRPVITAQIGRPLPENWSATLGLALAAAMATEVKTIPGAREALEATSAAGLDWRIASNSGVNELAAKFEATGLTNVVHGRVYSAEHAIARGGRGKPAPDLFLLARGDTPPAECLVLEDSVSGVQGAVAAGMSVVGFAPGGGDALLHAGADTMVRSLAEFVELAAALANS